MSGTYSTVLYFEDFNTTGPAAAVLGPEWEVYGDYAGNAGFGFRKQAQAAVVAEATSTSGGKVLRLTAQNVGGQMWSAGLKLHKPRTYGQYELRVRCSDDASAVTSGVVLLWPESNQWPRDGEVDWWESFDNRTTRTPVKSFVHRLNPAATLPYDAADDQTVVEVAHTGVDQSDWHKIVCSWAPDELSISIDNGPATVLTGDPANIPDWPMELCIQLDAWSNTPPASPVTMDVDYVVLREWTPPAGVTPFPRGRLDLKIEAAFGADPARPASWVWTDVTDRLLTEEITIHRGRPDEAASLQPSSITFTLDNGDGALTPGNGASVWYPNVRRGTPVRVSVDGAAPALTLPGTSWASTPNHASLRTTGDIDLRMRIQPDAWAVNTAWADGDRSPTTRQRLAAMWDGVTPDEGWGWQLLDAGWLGLEWSVDNTIPGDRFEWGDGLFASARPLWIATTLDVDDGAGHHVLRTYRWDGDHPGSGSPVITYSDDFSRTGQIVHRITRDAADRDLVNSMGNATGGEHTAWSPDSQRITYAKWSPTDASVNGIYVFDLATGRETALCTADSEWASPTFSHDGTEVWFLSGANGTPDGTGMKPWAVRKVTVPATLTPGPLPANVSTLVVDLRAAAVSAGTQVDDLKHIGRNAGTTTADRRFTVQANTGGAWRTLVLTTAGAFVTGWGLTTANDWHNNLNDGAAVWSPSDPDLLHTNRATGPGNHTAIRAVWNVTTLAQAYTVTTTSGAVQVGYGDWARHTATGTDIHMGAFRVPFTRAGTTSTTYPALGFIYGNSWVALDRSSGAGTDLAAVRAVVVEQDTGAEGFIYQITAGDYGIGATTVYGGWGDIQQHRILCHPRHRLDDFGNANLSRYVPHAHYSPDGRWLVYQSSSELNITGFSGFTYFYDPAKVGPQGGNDGTHQWTDLYLVPVSAAADAIDFTGGVPADLAEWTLVDTVTGTGTTSIHATTTAELRVGRLMTLGTLRGRVQAFELRDGINGKLVANPHFDEHLAGTTSFIDACGRTWTVGGAASMSTRRTRFVGTIDEIRPTWPAGDNNPTGSGGQPSEARVAITASDVLRRLGAGAKSLQSALRRHIISDRVSDRVLAYWPCEEPAGATALASGLPGGLYLSITGVEPGQDSTLAASAPLPKIKGGTTGTWVGWIDDTNALEAQWAAEIFVFLPSGSTTTELFTIVTSGGAVRWVLAVGDTEVRLDIYDLEGILQANTASLPSGRATGHWMLARLDASDDGAGTISWGWHLVQLDTGLVTTGTGTIVTIGGNVGHPVRVDTATLAPANGYSFGHIIISQGLGLGWLAGADTAWVGETAAHRVWRLCTEERVPVEVVGDPGGYNRLRGDLTLSEAMGPQTRASLVTLLAECQAIDLGYALPRRSVPGIVYRTRRTIEAQARPVLELDARLNHITQPLNPVLDDQRLRNQVEVKARGGTSAAVVNTASVATEGRYDTSIELAGVGGVPIQSSIFLAQPGLAGAVLTQNLHQAGWRTHLGTWPGLRYPTITIDLGIAPELIAAVHDLELGDRITLTGLPSQHPLEVVELIVDAIDDILSPVNWIVRLTCSAGGPWLVGRLSE